MNLNRQRPGVTGARIEAEQQDDQTEDEDRVHFCTEVTSTMRCAATTRERGFSVPPKK
jgi:hypothetical protein